MAYPNAPAGQLKVPFFIWICVVPAGLFAGQARSHKVLHCSQGQWCTCDLTGTALLSGAVVSCAPTVTALLSGAVVYLCSHKLLHCSQGQWCPVLPQVLHCSPGQWCPVLPQLLHCSPGQWCPVLPQVLHCSQGQCSTCGSGLAPRRGPHCQKRFPAPTKKPQSPGASVAKASAYACPVRSKRLASNR